MTEQEYLTSTDPAAMLGWIASDGSGPGKGPNRIPLSARRLRLFACACCRSVWHLLADPRSRKAVEVAERFADGRATGQESKQAFLAAVEAGTQMDHGPGRVMAATAAHAAQHPLRVTTRAINIPAVPGLPPATQAILLREIAGNPFRPVTQGSVCLSCGCPDFEPEVEYAACARCGRDMGCPWLTRDVLALAQTAYDERPGRVCERCKGTGVKWAEPYQPFMTLMTQINCPDCHGSGRIEDGTLDPVRLAVLHDALLEAGCDDEDILRHLRGQERCPDMDRRDSLNAHADYCDGWMPLRSGHVRGCWVVDTILGRE